MKRQLHSFISFSRTEKLGLAALLVILLLIIALRIAISYWTAPVKNIALEQKLHAISHPRDSTHSRTPLPTHHSPLTSKVNLNTADDSTLMQLPGMGRVYAHYIIQYRKQHGPFTNVSQLSSIPHFPPSLIPKLAPYITLK